MNTSVEELLEESKILFEPLKEGNPTRAMLVFLRTKYNLFTRAIAMVDRKSYIIVRLQFLIISVTVLIANYWESFTFWEIGIIGSISVTSLASLILALLSSGPADSWSIAKHKKNYKDPEEQLFDLRNLSGLEFDEYSNAFNKVLKDEKLVFSNIARDLFQMAHIVNYKYALLQWAYRFFIAGLAVALLLTLLSLTV